jgi:uncharacterized membrane protein
LAEELLGRAYGDLDEEEQRALCRVASTQIELDPDEEEVARGSFGDRLADRVAAIGGSWTFIGIFALSVAFWMVINGPIGRRMGVAWDAYPYILLNLALSTLATLQAPIIMMSQNRQARKDRISNRHDYEVNLRTTVELLKLHRKIDKMFNKIGQLQGDVQQVSERTEGAMTEVVAGGGVGRVAQTPPPPATGSPFGSVEVDVVQLARREIFGLQLSLQFGLPLFHRHAHGDKVDIRLPGLGENAAPFFFFLVVVLHLLAQHLQLGGCLVVRRVGQNVVEQDLARIVFDQAFVELVGIDAGFAAKFGIEVFLLQDHVDLDQVADLHADLAGLRRAGVLQFVEQGLDPVMVGLELGDGVGGGGHGGSCFAFRMKTKAGARCSC